MHDNFTKVHHAGGTIMGGPWQLRHVPIKGIAVQMVAEAAFQALQLVDKQMSNYNKDSDLMRLNNAPLNEFILVPKEIHTVMACADGHARMSQGAINIALGRLVNRWGFGPDPTPSLKPAIKDLNGEAALAKLGSYSLRKNPPAVCKTKDVAFDLCSLAKGFAVDQAAAALRALGVKNFLIEAAGEVFAQGVPEAGQHWRVGLELPVDAEERQIYDDVTLEGCAVATSGGYRNIRTIEGKQVAHTIDPNDGAPLDGALLSVSVVHETCMNADALATVLYVLGEVDGPKYAEDHALAALFLIRVPQGIKEIRSEAYHAQQT